MMEIGITGVDPLTFPELTAWRWRISVYLFLGGLVAGIMIIGAGLRLLRKEGFERASRIAEFAAIPMASVGLLALFADLRHGWNSWRFYTTFEPTSAMSWGAWILLIVMLVIGLRLMIYARELPSLGDRWERPVELVRRLGRILARRTRSIDVAFIVLGISLGFYTGILLSTIPARPVWDSVFLAPLFLVSGLTAGGAFLCLFLAKEAHLRLVPLILTFCAVELTLIIAFVASLHWGPAPLQIAADSLLTGPYAIGLWGGVVVLGLLVPVSIEIAEVARLNVPHVLSKIAPYFKMSGGLILRFVIVYAGLASAL